MEIINNDGPTKPRRQTKKMSINLSPATRRRPPPVRRKKQPEILPPIPLTPEQKFESTSLIGAMKPDGFGVVDNTKSTVKKSETKFKNKHSNFLITMNPNSSVRDEINPELYRKLKEEIKSFASFVLDPKNIDTVLKPSQDNKDPDWLSKIVGYGDDKVASIEDSKDTTKRLHCHIYLPIQHRTKILVNERNLRDIAEMMMEQIGIPTKCHLNVKVAFGTGMVNAREYILKQGGEQIN